MSGWLVVAGCTVSNPWFELAGASETTAGATAAETGTMTGAGPGAETLQPTTQGPGGSTDEPVSAGGTMTGVSSGPVTATEAATITTGPELTGTGTSTGEGETGALPDMGVSLCGNEVVDTGENCDDGNTLAGDGCENNCKFMFEATPLLLLEGAFDLAAADLDIDGMLDMVVSYVTPDMNDPEYTLLLNMGAGSFLAMPKEEAGWIGASRVLVGQLAGDGRPDLLFVAAGTGKLRILENKSVKGQLNFVPTDPVQIGNIAAVADATLVALDGDDYDDLLLVIGEKMSVRLANGMGGLLGGVPYASPLPTPVAVIAGPLIKGDTNNHVGLVHDDLGDDMSGFLNNGAGVLSKKADTQKHCPDGATSARVGDADGGGPIDVVVGCKGGQVVLVGNDGKAPYERKIEAPAPGINSVGTIDLYGGDEFADVYATSAAGKAVVVGVAADKAFVATHVEALSAAPTASAVGDYDGDGAPDLMVVMPKPAQLLLLRNQTRD